MRSLPSIAAIAILCLTLAGSGCTSTTETTPEVADANGVAATDPQAVKHFTEVVATVNGQPLYMSLYEQTLDYIRARLSADTRSADVERYLRARDEALDMIVNDELLYQEAQRQGLQAPDEDVAAEYMRVTRDAGGERAFLARMESQRVTRFEAIEGIRKRMTIDRYVQRSIGAGLMASDAEALEYYNTHLDRFTPDLWVKAAHILIRLPASPDAGQVQRARERAEKILANIRAGRPFESMAREFSEDGSAESGGELGFIKKGSGPPEFEPVLFSMKPGEVSEPVRTSEGFHILKVIEKKGGTPRDFAEVKEDCRKAVLAGKQAEAIQNVVSRLRASADIESQFD